MGGLDPLELIVKVRKALTGGSVSSLLTRPASWKDRSNFGHKVGGCPGISGADVVQPGEVVFHHPAVGAELDDDEAQQVSGKLEWS